MTEGRRDPLPASFASTRVGILGLGREGVALTRYLAAEGARIVVSDRASASSLAGPLAEISGCDVTLDLGGHDESLLLACDFLFVSPGVPWSLPVLAQAQQRGLRITSETELVFDRTPVPITAVTGSAGKTTTTTLVGKMLEADGRRVLVGGNIGRPVIGRLRHLAPDTHLVLELSSFQLQRLRQSPHVAAVLNVTPNHLDRHADMAEYVEAKRQIVAHQRPGDLAILNADDPEVRAFAAATPARTVYFSFTQLAAGRDGAYLDGDRLALRLGGADTGLVSTSEIRLPGQHNIANAAAAVAICSTHGVQPDAMRRVLRSFQGVEHRLELVATVAGVRFMNDSIATAPERLLAGLRAISDPIVLVAGGRDKHLPWDEAAQLICNRVRTVVTLGEAAPLIEAALVKAAQRTGLMPVVRRAVSMEQAVQMASEAAAPGQVVLLSPGCTSYDMYRDFEERGRAFKAAVTALHGAEVTT